ncbi:hypothetical protein N5T79_05050 [Aliarcobacter cryaerophilus]|uniref:hypothetical protein n=1 Tax=Aliarcobacter cryaerophilus TaxID=28198 RepID=UPI0021B5CE7F|nr:hypothetical protein [Aliarcobacter cryaerophilus]MCT7528504.1 hypothetical protein [Aliarcobacter cryaerophilus]
MKNENLIKLFGNIDVAQNGNLLFITRMIIHEAVLHNKEVNKLGELLQLLKIKRPALLLVRDIDEILQNKATTFDKEMKKKMDGLDDVPFLRPYLALFWQYKSILKRHNIKDLDYVFQYKRKDISIDFFNALPKIDNRILFSVLSFHYYCLELKENEKNEKFKYDDSFYENNSRTLLRAVEILVNLQFLKNKYINEVYFKTIEDDLIVNFINIVKENKYEKISYFIKENKDSKDKSIGNYIHYENQKNLNINFKLNSSRVIKRGESKTGEAINQNIVDYLGNGLYSYKKLIELKLKKEKGEANLNKSLSYEIQATQQEPFFENINNSLKQIKIPYEKEELIEINSKPTLSKRVIPKNEEEQEEDNTIVKPQVDIANSFKQLKQNRAYSANVTKDRLLLSNSYNIPEINLYKELIKFIAQKPFSETLNKEDIYNSIFLISVLTGFEFNDILNIFIYGKNKIYETKTGVLELNLNAEAINTIDDDIFFKKTNKKIKYLLPKLFINLIDKIKNELISNEMLEKGLINEDIYKEYIKGKTKQFNKTIHFNIDKTWYFLISYIRLHLKEDVTALFSLSKNFKSDESKLAYGSTAKDSLIFSNFLLKIYDELELENRLLNLFEWENIEYKISLHNDATIRAGSNRAIEPQKIKDFFAGLKNEINKSNNHIDKFNLFSIYTRVALGILLGTRTFNYSCSLDRVSFSFHTLVISEKSNTLISGIRVIPLCTQAEELIKDYQKKLTLLNIPNDNIYFMNSDKIYSLYSNEQATKILKDLNVSKELSNFLEKVPLNIGRHIISKYAIESNLNGFYLETFLGHYVSGAEQFGTFSNLNFKKYIETMQKFISEIAEIYGIY